MDFISIDTPLLAFLAMTAGFIFLIKGGDWVVGAAAHVARQFGLSPLIVGFTIVAFGTSLPELLVSVLANLDGAPGIAIGNVLGSNIANILMVVGAAALFMPLVTNSRAVLKDLVMMLAATAAFAALMLYGEIGRAAGALMVAALLAYVFAQYRMAVKGEMPDKEGEDGPDYKNRWTPYILLVLGLAGVALGADFLVKGAKFGAAYIGVPDAVVALSVIALGTSLPELSTSIIAARKGHSEIALGNVIGSNVFNILMIMGVTTAIKPIAAGSFAPQLVNFDIWMTVAVSVIFALILLWRGKITRPVGGVFVAVYILYNIYIYAIYMTP